MRVSLLALLTFAAVPLAAQTQASRLPERSIRGTIPMTNSIRRAHEAGTRDSTGRPGRNYWQLRTDYNLQVRIDPQTSVLHGSGTITLWNRSPDQLGALGFRLDPNIFRPRAYLASSWLPAETTDGMVITKLSVDGAAASLPAGSGVPPGMGATAGPRLSSTTTTNPTVSLATPIPAGGKAVIAVEWHYKLPGGPGSGHRMTQRWGDSVYQPTQWYPRLQAYDDLRGWNPDMYLGPSEFYNNFGTWDVAIEAPAGWLVSGTGVLQNPAEVLTPMVRERLATVLQTDAEVTIVGENERGAGRATMAGNRLVWRFHADTVNDFAWATSAQYVWKALRANIPTKGYVPIHMLHLPSRASLFASAGVISRHSLEYYSKLIFPYEFPQLTLQDGPSAGMEYPMVINSNAGAADHEVAHQWWPMVVGTNETWYGWLDEGFNQYMNILSKADSIGVPANFNRMGLSYGNTSGNEAEPPLMWNANFGGTMYSFQTYQKTPLMLSMLGGIVGDSVVQRVMREWGVTWKYKHPSPWDVMFFVNNAVKQDLSWFWYYWLFTTEAVHGKLASVTPTAQGARVVVRQDGEMPSPVVLKVVFEPTGPAIRPMANAVMRDSVTAVVTWPVDVWFGGSRSFTADLNFGGRKITRITLDPGCRFPDRNAADNLWTVEGGIPTTPSSTGATLTQVCTGM